MYELKKLRESISGKSLDVVLMYDIACILATHLKVWDYVGDFLMHTHNASGPIWCWVKVTSSSKSSKVPKRTDRHFVG